MSSIAELTAFLRASPGLNAKRDIAAATARLDPSPWPIGDDCAAIPDGDSFLLFAIEGFINEFVAADPYFAGWCGVMVNLADIAAMGGRAIAVTDAIWASGETQAAPVLAGMRDAARCYGVPIAGGHSNFRSTQAQLSVSVLGRAKTLLSSFAARPGENLIAAIDLRGAYREAFSNWQAALDAPPARLRGDFSLLPQIAEAGLSRAAKDISQGGIIGTAAMFCECSGVGMEITLSSIPSPPGIAAARWLTSFPSYGFLLTASAPNTQQILARFAAREIAASVIGTVNASRKLTITDGKIAEEMWDFSKNPYIGCGPARVPA